MSDLKRVNTFSLERDMIRTVARFGCVSKEQFAYLLPIGEHTTADHISYVTDACVGKGRIVLRDGIYLPTPLSVADHAMIDALWIMIFHLKANGKRTEDAHATACHADESPAKLCYSMETGDGAQSRTYFVALIRDRYDIADLIVMNERLLYYGDRTARDLISVYVGLWDMSLVESLPALTFRTRAFLLSHTEGWADIPEVRAL